MGMGHQVPVADGVLEAVELGLEDSVDDGVELGVFDSVELGLGVELGVLLSVALGLGVLLGVLDTVADGVADGVRLGVLLGVELTVALGEFGDPRIAFRSVTKSSPHSLSANADRRSSSSRSEHVARFPARIPASSSA
jgi:hypothetical protein